MAFFYSPDISSPYITLDAEESRHCVKVMRLREGDTLEVVDGCGRLCHCSVVRPDASGCVVAVERCEENYRVRPFRLHLAVAPTKNTARIEWLVEKAVEIGVDEITPIVCDHSERNIQKVERLHKIAVSAMKQSQRAMLPALHDAVDLRSFVGRYAADRATVRMVCYCEGDQRVPLSSVYSAGSDAVVLIGPEGDFSKEEIGMTIAAGFAPITLGDTRLRTETAALYAISALNFMNER